MIAISSLDFLLLSRLHVRLRNALLNLEVHQEFWKTSGFEMWVASTSHANVTFLLFRLSDLITFMQKPLYACSYKCGSSQSSASGRRLSLLACNLLWPCSLIETLDRLKWDSLISKVFLSYTDPLTPSYIIWPGSWRERVRTGWRERVRKKPSGPVQTRPDPLQYFYFVYILFFF